MNYRMVILVGIVVLITIVFYYLTIGPQSSPTTPTSTSLVTTKTPVKVDFTFRAIDGRVLKVSDFRGKIVLVDFWATWCRPCVAEMEELKKLYERYSDKIVIISISLDESRDRIVKFINERGIEWIVGWDPKGEVARKFGIRAIPTLLIIDKNGFLVRKVIGYHSFGELLDLIRNSTGESI